MKPQAFIPILILLFCREVTSGQNETWINYNSGNMVTAIAEHGDILWVGTYDGLVKLDKQTGQQLKYYNRTNSPFRCYGVNDMALDNQGDVWIATWQGLLRLSDTLWTVYNPSNSGIPDSYLSSIKIDSHGYLWLGSASHGLVFWDGVTWISYTTSNSNIPTNNIQYISLDVQGNAWLSTEDKGLVKFNGNTFQSFTMTNSGIPSNNPRKTITGPDSSLWIATHGGGLARLKHGNWTVYNNSNSGIGSNALDPVAVDSAGNIWTGAGYYCKSAGSNNVTGSLFRFDGTSWSGYNTANSGLAADMINVIYGGINGNIWIGTIKGMCGFDGTVWTPYQTGNSGLPDNGTSRIGFAPNNVKWISCGSYGYSGINFGGLATFDNENWNVFTTANSGLKWRDVAFALPDSDKVWIGYQGGYGGLSCLQGTNWTWYKDSAAGFPNWTFDMKINPSNHDIWVAGGLGFGKFDNVNWTVYNNSNSPFPGNAAHGIDIDSQGNVWVACSEEFHTTGGLIKFDGQNFNLYQKSNSALPEDAVTDVLVDPMDDIWIATIHPGLVKFNGTTFTVFDTTNGAPDICFNRIARDSYGNIWGVSWNKIAMFDGQNWTVYNFPGADCNYNRTDIEIDPFDNIWISGLPMGVFVFNPGGIMLGTDPPLPSADKKNLKAYPNPATDRLCIELPSTVKVGETLEVRLLTCQGTTVLVRQLEVSSGKLELTDLSLPPGIYLYTLKIPCHGQSFSGKIIITSANR